MALFNRSRQPGKTEEDREYLSDGDVFGEYTILRRISYSIIGCLYLAEQRVSLRKVCLMVLPSKASSDSRFGERFRTMVQRVKRLEHANLLPLLDGTIISRRYVLVYEAVEHGATTLEDYPDELMAGKLPHSEHPFTLQGQQERDTRERVPESRGEVEEGIDLSKATEIPQPRVSRFPFLRTRNPLGIPLPRSRAVAVPHEKAAPILRQLLEVMKVVHREGLDHLSLTPSSVIYMPSGSIKLFNVGVTHTLEKELFERIVSASISPIQQGPKRVRLSTIDMFSPEIRGGQAYRATSDIYGLGVLTYWFVTGRKPGMGRFQSPREHVPDLPATWDVFLFKSLDTDPSSRYSTVASQLSEFIRINLPPKKGSGRIATQLERIPVPARVRERGERYAFAWRLASIGFVGVVLVGLMGVLFPRLVIDDVVGAGLRRVAYPALPGGDPDVRLRFRPERVRVEFEGSDSKFIVLNGELDLKVRSGNHRVAISSPNHDMRVIDLQVRDQPLGIVNVLLRPRWGHLRAFGLPGTRLMGIDEMGNQWEFGLIPSDGVLEVGEGVYSGRYRVVAERTDYRSLELEAVDLPSNRVVEIELPLEPLPAHVEVISNPEGAEIWMNGEVVGRTPAKIGDLDVLEGVEFVVQMEGYRERSRVLDLRPNANVLLDFGNLIRKTGEVRPRVKLDGRTPSPEEMNQVTYRVGGVSFPGNEPILAPIVEGSHELVVEHPNYLPLRIPISVGDQRFTPVVADLKPRPGQLTLRMSSQVSFQLLVNGRELEPVDGAGSNFILEPGVDYDLVLQIRDHRSIRRSLRLGANQREVWRVQPEPIPGPVVGEAYAVPYVGIQMAPISPGTFMMGSPPEEIARLPSEGPRTEVRLTNPYWIGRHEVTQRQYEFIMESNPSAFRGPDLPVDSVTWQEARAFCQRLTALESQAGRLPEGYVYRLPTEAEWEYAARGGNQSPFQWGETADPSFGNFKGVYPRDFLEDTEISSIYGTVPVGSYQPNDWGLYDVHGNVREWTRDYWNARLPGGVQTNPTGPSSSRQRAWRGGGWEDPAQRARVAERGGLSPSTKSSSMGFRVVLAPTLGD